MQGAPQPAIELERQAKDDNLVEYVRPEPAACMHEMVEGEVNMRHAYLRACLSLFLFLSANVALAIDPTVGRVILKVTGSIGNTNTQNSTAEFDEGMLRDLGTHIVATDTPWTTGVNEFGGPLVRDLLAAVDARGTIVTARALNDYEVQIPISDFLDHNTILAIQINGKRMSVRERGPIWIIYPWDEKPGLKNEEIYTRSIWQLFELEIE